MPDRVSSTEGRVPTMDGADDQEIVIKVSGLKTHFGKQVVHDGVELEVRRGEVLGVVGGSGTGKSVLLREIVGLQKVNAGSINVLGTEVTSSGPDAQHALRQNWGVMFQEGALFSSLTVAQNIQVPIRELTDFPQWAQDEIARVKLAMVGLPADAGAKYPSQISGGMKKRAGLARALALDPEILFLDEPTAGLDPISATQFDELIKTLKLSLNLTVFMVTHDLDSLVAICDRIAVLVDKKIVVGRLEELMEVDNPWIQEYFRGPRGRAALGNEANSNRTAGNDKAGPGKKERN
jgi:phospholipid/cholesterol/gamma-HCH transport system ATP-binding protein